MRKSTILVALASAFIGAISSISVQSFAQHNQEPTKHANMQTPSMQMHKAMMAPMKQMKMSGDVDRDFAAMMTEHHRSAVVMAQIELKHGKVPELKKMSKEIIRSQSAEIKILMRHAKMKH